MSSFDTIYCHLGCYASPETIVLLLSSQFVSVVLYGLDSCLTNVTDLRSLAHPVTMEFGNIFNIYSNKDIGYCKSAFVFNSVRVQVLGRKLSFQLN